MQPRDWTLLVIAAAKGEPLQPVQLQKALFLIDRNLTPAQRQVATFYDFRAYDFGPFSQEIYSHAEELNLLGLIRISRRASQSYADYAATPAGLEQAADLRKQLAAPVCDYLDRVVTWVRALSFDQLVRAIYAKYPEMKVNSVFVG